MAAINSTVNSKVAASVKDIKDAKDNRQQPPTTIAPKQVLAFSPPQQQVVLFSPQPPIFEHLKMAADIQKVVDNKVTADNQFIENSDQYVLINVPTGKPNRKDGGKTRVLQKAQKGGTCWYYAAKVTAILKPNYVQEQNKPPRKAASNLRKAQTLLDANSTNINKWLQNMFLARLQGVPGKFKRAFLEDKKLTKEYFEFFRREKLSLDDAVEFNRIMIPLMEYYYL